MYGGRGPWMRQLTLNLQRALFFGTTLAVWAGHHRALRAGGLPLRRFWSLAWQRMTLHWRHMGLIPWGAESRGRCIEPERPPEPGPIFR